MERAAPVGVPEGGLMVLETVIERETMRKRDLRNIIRAVFFLTLFAAAGIHPAGAGEGGIEVKHDMGTARLPGRPTRVVLFDFGVLDTLDRLAPQGVSYAIPKQVVPGYLSRFKAADVMDAGGMKEPNLEKIYEFGPDVIFISARQTDYYQKFSAIAPTINSTVDYSRFLESFAETTRMVGRVFGVEEKAEAEVAKVAERASAVAKKAAASGKRGLVVMVNDGNISAYGPGSRFGTIHDVMKVAPADPGIKVSNHGQSVDYEYIARINPDILFVINRNAAIGTNGNKSGSNVLDNELVAGTNAGRNGKIVQLDSEVWYLVGTGLQALEKMMNEVETAIQ